MCRSMAFFGTEINVNLINKGYVKNRAGVLLLSDKLDGVKVSKCW